MAPLLTGLLLYMTSLSVRTPEHRAQRYSHWLHGVGWRIPLSRHCLLCHILVKNASFGYTIPAFNGHATVLYFRLVRCNVVWNSVTCTDGNERIQQKFSCPMFLKSVRAVKIAHLTKEDALFLAQVYRGSKFCPSELETVRARVPPRYIRDFSMFSVSSCSQIWPFARCASAA
jgi:hypothetical protein